LHGPWLRFYDISASCRSKAGDLKEQLIWWQTPPENAWPARDQRLDWLEHALGEARDIARGLQQHGALTEEANAIATYVDIVKVCRLLPGASLGMPHMQY
jgi:hypothetical protein